MLDGRAWHGCGTVVVLIFVRCMRCSPGNCDMCEVATGGQLVTNIKCPLPLTASSSSSGHHQPPPALLQSPITKPDSSQRNRWSRNVLTSHLEPETFGGIHSEHVANWCLWSVSENILTLHSDKWVQPEEDPRVGAFSVIVSKTSWRLVSSTSVLAAARCPSLPPLLHWFSFSSRAPPPVH